MGIRTILPDFNLANPFYAGAQVTAWVVDVETLEATDVKAVLYADTSGVRQLLNPATLDGDGKWKLVPYVEQSVILEIEASGVTTHSTGIIARMGYPRDDWATDTEYWPGDFVLEGTPGALYECLVPHTSDVFADDLDEEYWALVVDPSGISEAPEDGAFYGRQNAAWAAVASDTRMTAAEAAIAALSGGIGFIGSYNATAHTADYTTESGFADGALVAASTATNKYVIVTVAGTGASPAPVVSLAVGDWLVSNGTAWYKVPLSASTLAASQVTITSISGIAATDVQGTLAEISGDVTAEVAARIAAVSAEAATRLADDTAEANTRSAADIALAASIALKLSDAVSDNYAYGRRDAGWVKVVQRNIRVVSGTSDTPTVNVDKDGIILCRSGSATTITANDLGDGISYSIQQQGAGQVTVAAGSGVTLVSDKSSASYITARKGAWLTVMCRGNGEVLVAGNTA